MELATALAARGWSVSILASRIPSDSPTLEEREGVQIHRVRTLPFTRKNLLLRAISLASVYPAFFFRALGLSKPDIIVSLTDPPLLSVIADVLHRIWKVPHVHWAQDVYPETAIQLGVFSKDSIISRLFLSVAHGALRRSQSVVVIGRCMEKYLKTQEISRLHFIPNWTDPDLIQPDEAQGTDFRKRHDLIDKFVISYIGNIGLAHGLEWFLQIAPLLKTVLPNACFIFAGNGPRRKWLEEHIREQRLDNIILLDSVGKADLSAAYSGADIHITSMDRRLDGLVVPSKIYAAFASQKPCVFIGPVNSEAAQAILDAKAGAAFDPDDKESFIAFVKACAEQQTLSQEYGQNARKAVYGYTLSTAATAFEKELADVISREKTPQQARS